MSETTVGGKSFTSEYRRLSFSQYSTKFYRGDIQGIRAVSAILIMVYHIWFARVSGGVDVFFVISGFLMTTTLLRGLAAKGTIRTVAFWSRICQRIFPSAYTVLLATLALSVFFVPAPLWKYSVNEFIASAAQIENFELIRMSTDYLSRKAPPSQFQQFWALSIQMQFYLVLPFVLMLLVLVVRWSRSLKPLFWGVSALVAISLVFSVFLTGTAPYQAYFHPLARAWEFLVGALVAIAYPTLVTLVGRRVLLWNLLTIVSAVTLSTLGLTLGDQAFPGWIALIPVTCAVILIAAGATAGEPTLVTKALGSRILVYFGGFSFTIYLWHWPVLVCAQHLLDTTHLNLFQGVAVIAIALALAVLTNRFIEIPMTRRPAERLGRRLIVLLLLALSVVGLGLVLREGIARISAEQRGNISYVSTDQALAGDEQSGIPVEKFIAVDLDRPTGIGCLWMSCAGGDPDAEKTIVLVGESHAAQWFDVIDEFGKEYGYRVITRLSDGDFASIVEQTGADVVVTNSTLTTVNGESPRESVPTDRIKQFESVAAAGAQIVAIRDNPRFGIYQNACVWKNQSAPDACAIGQAEQFDPVDPSALLAMQIPGFHSVDLTDLFCFDGTCPAVHDGILMYYDKHHISKSYSNYIADAAIGEIASQVPLLTLHE